MSAELERAIYDSGREVVEALRDLIFAVSAMREHVEEMCTALEGIRKEIDISNKRVDNLKF